MSTGQRFSPYVVGCFVLADGSAEPFIFSGRMRGLQYETWECAETVANDAVKGIAQRKFVRVPGSAVRVACWVGTESDRRHRQWPGNEYVVAEVGHLAGYLGVAEDIVRSLPLEELLGSIVWKGRRMIHAPVLLDVIPLRVQAVAS